MKELITKAPDGNLILTPLGEQELYSITTKKLMEYYLKDVLKKDSKTISGILNSLTPFISNTFKKVDDYLNKLPELAGFIQESNLEKFQKFMGQYFISTLQKEKQFFLQRESELIKEKLNNPYWVPSNQLLKDFGPLFEKAPALKYPIVEIVKQEQDIPVKKEIIKTPDTPPQIIEVQPGIRLLDSVESAFAKASPLDLTKFLNKEITEEEIPVKKPEPTSKASAQSYDNTNLDPPGVRLLNEIGNSFNNCPPLEKNAETVIHETNDRIPVENKLISLKAYAMLLSNIAKFTKNKDNEGYQKWYNSLSSLQRAAVKMNSLHNAEKKGNPVNWGKEIMMYAASANENKDSIYQLSEEIKLYMKLIHYIRHRLTNDPKIKIGQQEASNIYSQSINILSGTESPAEKKSAITILLFQVTDSAMRQTLLQDFEKVIKALS